MRLLTEGLGYGFRIGRFEAKVYRCRAWLAADHATYYRTTYISICVAKVCLSLTFGAL